jgi:separase
MSFTQAVKAFPFSEFTTQALMGGPSVVFNGSSSLKQLGTIIDKLTYLGSCELLLEPSRVSLKITAAAYPPAITGILLERQLDSLNGTIRKEDVQELCMQLLADAKNVYREDEMPIRKARILVRALDLMYHTGSHGPENSEEIGKEAEKLLTRTVSPFVQYLIIPNLC